jgi:hypothetical protein
MKKMTMQLKRRTQKPMKKTCISLTLVVSIALLAVVPMAARDEGFKVKYNGGSVTAFKTGAELKLYVESDKIRFQGGKKDDPVEIPSSAITEISYGQDVHRRVGTAVAVGLVSFGIGALTALSKSKKHFIGLTWADGDKKGGLALQCDKNDYRGVLSALEGVTGKRAVDSDAMTVKN